MTIAHILVMLLACNGAPLVLEWLLRPYHSTAVDLGKTLADGRPLLGDSKTWLGVSAMLLTGTVLATVFDFGWKFGLAFGSLAALGDLISSFAKRRLGLSPSAQKDGLDQLPESVLPVIYAVTSLGLHWTQVVTLPLAFWAAQRILSKVLFHLGIRRQPY